MMMKTTGKICLQQTKVFSVAPTSNLKVNYTLFDTNGK